MAYVTENTYTGNNSTVLFSFTFPYLEKTDVKVSIDQVDTTAFTFANATQIQLNSASGTDGKTIRIYRDTNIDNLKAEFFSGSAIRSQDLNEDFNQNLYNSQESEAAVALKWNKTTDTIDSTEAFSDSNDLLMTAAAIDDRINANIASQPLANGKIFAGNGSGVAAAVTPSGDVTMANTGAFTIGTGAVEHAMLAGDAVDGDNIGDDVVNSEHIAAGAIDLEHMSSASVDSDNIVDDSIVNADINSSAAIAHSKLANLTSAQVLVGNGSNVPTGVAISGDVTLANTGAVTIANDAVEQAMIADDAVGADQLASNAVVNDSVAAGAAIAHSKLANVSSGQIIVGNGSNVPTSVAMSGDVAIAAGGATTIQTNAIDIAMVACDQQTITDSDNHIPTSGAVVDYVAAAIAPIGGLEVIADDESFPNTIAPAGVVISITDCAGLSVNSSGVSTNADTLDNSTVTINGFPTELRGGEGTNADPYVFQSGAGLMVKSTGSSQTYDYHQALIRESDFVRLSDDINDFNNRYRISSGEPSGTDDEGDLYFDTGSNKMFVYDGSAWGEVTSTGDFKYLVLCVFNSGSGNAGLINGSVSKYDLRESSTSGSLANVTSAAQLTVSINGIVQKPNTGTSISSNDGFCMVDAHTIEFGANIPASSEVFIVQSGSAISIPTPGDNTVSEAKIQVGAVSHTRLAADCVDGDNIQDDVINSEHIAAGAIDTEHIGNDQIDSQHYAAGSIDLEHMSSQSVDEDNLYIDNAGSNGQVLTKQSGGTGGLLWADASGGGAVGGGADKIFMENGQTVTTNYTIGTEFGAACNALTAGPITINNSIVVTIDSGDNWTII